MRLKNVALFLPLLCPNLLPGQSEDLKTKVNNLTQQIETAVDRGDLKKALDLYHQLGKSIDAEILKRKPTPAQKLTQLEADYASKTSDRARFYGLLGVPRAAYDAGEYYKAEHYAMLLLDAANLRKNNDFYADAIFEGNTIRGRVLLQHKDVAGAKAALAASIGPAVESGTMRRSAQITDLAQDLLNAGERDAVVQFLSSSKPFLASHRDKLDLWIATIRGGGNPELKRLY